MFESTRKRLAKFIHADKPLPEQPPKGEQAWANDGFFLSSAFETWRGDDLKMRLGNGIYKKMLMDDQISAAVDLINAAITGRRWRFVVEEEEQQEIADLLTFNLTRKMHGTIIQLMNYMLWARVEGFSVVEKVYGTFQMEGKEQWGLANFKLRPNDTLFAKTDKHGNLVELRQELAGETLKLNPQRFIYSVYKPELDAQYGQSALRAAYPHFWAKGNIYAFWNIFMERMAGGFTIATVEKKLEAGEEQALRKVMENIQASTNITLPAGVEIEHHMPTEKGAFKEAIMSRNMSMSRALLLPSLVGFGEETSTGSQARSQTQMQVWWLFLDALAGWVADTLNEQLFRELTMWNFGDVEPPLFELESLTQEQKQMFAEQWTAAVAGGVVKNSVDDETRFRDLLHFPERDPDAELLEEKEPEGSNPEGGVIPPDDNPADLPSGSNPLDSASSGMRSALDAGNEFMGRTNFTEIGEQVYQVQEEAFGDDLFRAVDNVWHDMQTEVLVNAPWTLAKVPNLSAPDSTEMEAVLRQHLNETFDLGQGFAMKEINSIRTERGLEPVEAQPQISSEFTMSHMAKLEMEYAGFAMSQETAEQYLEIKLLQMVNHIVSDQILASVRLSITNGLRSEQGIDEMLANAMATLKPIIGERDINGNLITEAALPARLATLIRTSLTESFNEGRRTFFEDPALEDYVQAYQYSAVIDDRTTQFCKDANGRIWPVASNLWQRYVPPNHFNCRSLLVPVVQGDQWSASLDLPQNVQPAPGFGVRP